MRTRGDIEKEYLDRTFEAGFDRVDIIMEILLDIRDLLSNPPIEVSGITIPRQVKIL